MLTWRVTNYCDSFIASNFKSISFAEINIDECKSISDKDIRQFDISDFLMQTQLCLTFNLFLHQNQMN